MFISTYLQKLKSQVNKLEKQQQHVLKAEGGE